MDQIRRTPNSSNTPNKCFVYDAAIDSEAITNAKARLAEAYTTTSACSNTTLPTTITDEAFNYTVRGEVQDVYESTPHSGGYYRVTQGYWADGALSTISNFSSLPTITYGADGEGRTSTVFASSGTNPVPTATSYNVAGQPTQVNLGSGDNDAFQYDSNTFRMTQYQFNINGHSNTGVLTWNANWSLGKLAITDAFNSSDTQTCTYIHDDLSRVANANCGSAFSGTYTYDAFGNLTKSGTYSFQPNYSPSTNQMTSIGSFTPTYDANGDVTNDNLNTYAWDVETRPTTIDGIGITYDALERMVEQNKSGIYSQIVWSPTGIKLGYMSGQTFVQGNVPLPAGLVVPYNSNGIVGYQHMDWLGSYRLLSLPNRTVYYDGAYGPFGETYAQSGNSVDYAFTGQHEDTVSSAYDFLYREYGPQGRWPSPDPAGTAAVDPANPQSWNRYAYVLNNPLVFIDPFGLSGACVVGVDSGNPHIDPTITTQEACGNANGIWIDTNQKVTVTTNPDNIMPPINGCIAVTVDGVSTGGSICGPLANRPPSRVSMGPGGGGGFNPLQRKPTVACVAAAAGKGGLKVGLDALSLIPELGGFARLLGHSAGYRGVVADQAGRSIIQATTGASSAGNATDTALTVAGFIPGLEQATGVASAGVHGAQTLLAIANCR